MERGLTGAPSILVLVVNHKAAGIHIRERLAFGRERIPGALDDLIKGSASFPNPFHEAVLLSTCNRTEIYVHAQNLSGAVECIQDFCAAHAGMPAEALQKLQYTFRGDDAVLHLMQVAAGLDSLVVGENEILGQVRAAADIAHEAGTCGPVLSALFRHAIQAGKRSRTETSIGSEGISVASVVVELAAQMVGPLSQHTALLIGAGKISSMTARALAGAGLRWILVANRTHERAQKLAKSLNGEAVHFDMLEQCLAKADIVICSTGAPHVVLHADAVARAQQARLGRPLLIADLAVPRDVEAQIASIPGVRLVNIDDLESIMRNSHVPADSVCGEVEAIARQEMEAFGRWYAARCCVPVIQALHRKAEQIEKAEVEDILSRMGPLTPRQEQLLRAMAESIAAKMLHDPVTRLRELATDDEISSYLNLTRDLYRLL
jgi:glutamyl-tRNA reductase